jgi:tRNA A-37 threonylcarbamoyl transferase component Bud32/tetratricopeptide (TPR) repeat protein
MHLWSFTLHGPGGILSTLESGETQFVLGTEQAADVWTIAGEGVAPRHALVRVAAGRIEVEDLAGGTLVNGHQITGRVEAEYPASVQVGEVTLVVEQKSEDLSQAVTIVQSPRQGGGGFHELEATVVTPRAVQQTVSVASGQSYADHNGRYALVKEIARGGMGQIYFGEDPQLERQVAVKVSSISEGCEDPRFTKEAKVLALLAHPNIVPIYTVGVDALGRPFYSMKLVKGRTLQAVLNALKDGEAAATKEYTQAALLTIFRKVCDAMAFAHAKGILHRDLKPENIMVGEYGEVLVMDWGLAKILGERDAAGAVKAAATDTGDYGMTLEGEVMGTPQYMSSEQAEGMVAELDVRSDIYSLGGILYAILTLRPPVGGSTLAEVLGNVKSGVLSPMGTATRMAKGIGGRPEPMTVAVPAALQAVTLKAMARDRDKRYASVELFAEDIESYQNGFATSAESAGVLRRARLWIARNRTLAASAAVLLVLVGKVVVDGQRAALAIRRLSASAPVFAARAQELLRDGDFSGALEAAENAVDLEPGNASNHVVRGNALQVLMRLEDAKKAYERALVMGGAEGAQEGLQLTEAVLGAVAKDGEAKAKLALYEGLSASGRQMEALAFGKGLGDFWKERKQDVSVIPELVKRLEEKLLPVPGTEVLLSKTEFTVGEWKLYLKAEGLPDWQQPARDWTQTDEHPVVNVSWNQAVKFCEWLSKVTGKEWRLPTNTEWEAAVGTSTYPWGDYYPPHWDDGNYSILADGKDDPKRIGVDGILGTAPVASFKPNVLGFYDLGGNVTEWMLDGFDVKDPKSNRVFRGGYFNRSADNARSADRGTNTPSVATLNGSGFRLARGHLQSGGAGSR